jgi:hypothetical protein
MRRADFATNPGETSSQRCKLAVDARYTALIGIVQARVVEASLTYFG